MDKNKTDEIDTEDHREQLSVSMKIVKIITKVIIAAMLYACWASLLTKYFNLFLLFSFAGFVWITYKELRLNNLITMIFSLMGTVLLNPLYPMYFNEGMQYAVYLILAIGLLGSAVFDLFKSSPDYENTKFGS
jgi:hypothetical protein